MLGLISSLMRRFATFCSEAPFLKWLALSAILGLAVPSFYVIAAVFGVNVGSAERLWPTSLFLMGLDTPNPTITMIVITYALALLGNVVVYVAFGLLI